MTEYNFKWPEHRWWPSSPNEEGLVDIALYLASVENGTSDDHNNNIEELCAWLKWRITRHWEPCATPKMAAFEASVYQMCAQALALYGHEVPSLSCIEMKNAAHSYLETSEEAKCTTSEEAKCTPREKLSAGGWSSTGSKRG